MPYFSIGSIFLQRHFKPEAIFNAKRHFRSVRYYKNTLLRILSFWNIEFCL
jgi:hypothetical protein